MKNVVYMLLFQSYLRLYQRTACQQKVGINTNRVMRIYVTDQQMALLMEKLPVKKKTIRLSSYKLSRSRLQTFDPFCTFSYVQPWGGGGVGTCT